MQTDLETHQTLNLYPSFQLGNIVVGGVVNVLQKAFYNFFVRLSIKERERDLCPAQWNRIQWNPILE